VTPDHNDTRVSRPWLPYLGGGTALIVIGELIVGAARSSPADGVSAGERHAEVFGSIVVTIGIVVALVGVIALGVSVALAGRGIDPQPIAEDHEPGPALRPPQSDPDGLAEDPDPFAPHAGDSAVVADVRRACGYGARQVAIRRIIKQAARAGQLNDVDRPMVEGLLAESERRTLKPLRSPDHR
jgi:hypothetical protein